MLIQDLHSHTYYSNCGRDDPELVVRAAVNGGVKQLGICDHNYGIGERKPQYFEEMKALRAKHAHEIDLKIGVEIATINGKCLLPDEDITWADFCLIEHIDMEESCVGPYKLIEFAKRCGTKTGIAHTDMFAMLEKHKIDPLAYFTLLSENGIYWEMNVNYDSIHKYREHEYVKKFMESEYQQEIIRKSGMEIAVGFDGHRIEDYLPERVINMSKWLQENGIPMPFDGTKKANLE